LSTTYAEYIKEKAVKEQREKAEAAETKRKAFEEAAKAREEEYKKI